MATRSPACSSRQLTGRAHPCGATRGLVHAALGARFPAMVDLAGYLEHAPDAPDQPAIRKRLAELGDGDASRLH